MNTQSDLLLLALEWFSSHFTKCSERARLVKTWLPETAMEGPSWLGQLVYDRALQLVCLNFFFYLVIVSNFYIV